MKSHPGNELSIPMLKTAMTPFPFTIELDRSLSDAVTMMGEHGIHHLPVTENGELAGVITDSDIKWALDPLGPLKQRDELQVRDVCRREVYAVDIHESLVKVLLEMSQQHIGSALVLKHGKLVGIFTTTDACHQFAQLLDQLTVPLDDLVA